MKRFAQLLALAALAVGLTASVRAVPITGSLTFASPGITLDATTVAAATEVVAWNATVGGTSGSFSSIAAGSSVSFLTPWVFTSTPNALWSVGGFSFDLTSSSVTYQPLLGGGTSLTISGLGVMHGPAGYDATSGLFSFTTQDPSSGSANTTFSFSASARALPDGGTTALLLGAGLVGLAAFARSRKHVA